MKLSFNSSFINYTIGKYCSLLIAIITLPIFLNELKYAYFEIEDPINSSRIIISILFFIGYLGNIIGYRQLAIDTKQRKFYLLTQYIIIILLISFTIDIFSQYYFEIPKFLSHVVAWILLFTSMLLSITLLKQTKLPSIIRNVGLIGLFSGINGIIHEITYFIQLESIKNNYLIFYLRSMWLLNVVLIVILDIIFYSMSYWYFARKKMKKNDL